MALSRWSYQLLIFSLFSLAQAYTVFNTNCTAPAAPTNFVSSPNTRGTLDILWSSLFTIFVCTWSVQHPNIPEQGEAYYHVSSLKGWHAWACPAWRNTKGGLKIFYRSALRMLLTTIAPEMLVVVACNELVRARSLCRRMKELDLGGDETWTLTHSYYANMGGFIVRNPSADKTIYHDPYHLTGEDVLELRRRRHMTKLPSITEAEIRDKSKGDMFGKLIAVGQITWYIAQIIARSVKKLPVSPLEVAVVALAVCAIFSYGLYWKKPQRVQVAQTIQLNDNTYLYRRNRKPEQTSRVFQFILDMILDSFKIIHKNNLLYGMPISMDSSSISSKKGRRNLTNTRGIQFLVVVSAGLFGGLHAIAWNFPFPTKIELVLWRISSIYTAAVPCYALSVSRRLTLLPPTEMINPYEVSILIVLLGCAIVLYAIARAFIIVEMFRILLFLPPGSFISTWASSVPHVA